MKHTRIKYILVISFIILLIIAYINHFDNGFHSDDEHTVVNNVNIRDLSNIPDFFHDPTMFSSLYSSRSLRPIVTTTLAIDYWIAGGLHPWSFQLSTFLWHIGLSIMLFFLYNRFISNSISQPWGFYIALFGAGLFSIHIAAAETINYVIARSDVFSTFFITASFLIFVAYPEKRKFHIYIIPALLGILCKETVPTLPIIIFFYILIFEEDISIIDIFSKNGLRLTGKTILKIIPLTISIAILQVYILSKSVTESLTIHLSDSPALNYYLTLPYVWFHYFRTFFFPYTLSFDPYIEVLDLYDNRIIVGLLFLITLIIIIFKTSKIKETKPIAFGFIWFLVAQIPTSIIRLGEVMNDHRMYFPFVGLTLSVLSAIGLIVIRKQQYLKKGNNLKILIISICVVIGIHSFGVFKRNQVWDTNMSLWKDVTEKKPKSSKLAWFHYGTGLMNQGEYQLAIDCFQKAEEATNKIHRFNNSLIYINLAICYGVLGKDKEAIDSFEKAKNMNPRNHLSYQYYAKYHLNKGNIYEAKDLIEKARLLNKYEREINKIALKVYQVLEMWPELTVVANDILENSPSDDQALAYLESAKKKEIVTGSMPTSQLINISLHQYNIGEYEGCIATCKKIILQDPKNVNAYNNMCAAYNMMKQWDEGIEACKKALKLAPDHPNAAANLRWALDGKKVSV